MVGIASYGAFQMGKLPYAIGFLVLFVVIIVIWNRPSAVLQFGLPARHGKRWSFGGTASQVLEQLNGLQTSDSHAEGWLKKAWALGQVSQITFALTTIGALWRIYSHSLNHQPLLGFSPQEKLYLGGGASVTVLLWVVGGLIRLVFTGRDLHNGKLTLLKGVVRYLGCDLGPKGKVRITASLGTPRFRVHRVLRMFSMLGQPLVKEGYLDHWFTVSTVLVDGTRLRLTIVVRGKRSIKFKHKFKNQGQQSGFIKYGMPRASSRTCVRVQPPEGQSYHERSVTMNLGEPKGFLRANVKKLEIERQLIKMEVRQGGALELEQVLEPLVWLFRGVSRARQG